MGEFKDAIKKFYWNPYGFVKHVIRPKEITIQQESILRAIPFAIKERKHIAVKSGHGVGKTTIQAWIILWWMTTRPNTRVPCTAPTQHQLYDVLWSELGKWWAQSGVKTMFNFTKTHLYSTIDQDSFAVALTSNSPEGMQGMHAENLLFIIEEASGVPKEIMQVVEGALTQEGALCMMFGNPTQITGFFHDAFHKRREFHKCFTLNAEKAPSWLVKPQSYLDLQKKYGRDSDIYRVRVLGEFPKAESDTLISLSRIEKALQNRIDVDQEAETIYIGADIARFGNDETVIAVRRGRKLLGLYPYAKQDTMATSGRIAEIIEKFPGREVVVNIDDTGLGGGVTDRVREVYRVNDKITVNIMY